ncbi:hypothetical protein MVEN_02444700 [Mycena venus]|uniref:Uncharacterized protein n=1 Tax=Mycena venus TaxID=2733690 RepID=A0A8H7CB03_9AGAR|nr:hypothetical protein MVEN_02444700 [Mycena venus]
MATHSPQRSRKPQAHPLTPGSMHIQAREMSPSPTHRPRSMKTVSMPVVPSVMQIFGPGNSGQQASPTATHNLNALQRSPPNTRLLPSPPHSAPHEPEREVTPPHHPRPINRVAPPQFLTQLEENWQMTDELMAEIERADFQQAQSNSQYPRESPPKVDPAVERIRAAERVSPKNLDGLQRRQSLRDSPKARISPTTSSFAQAPRTPEGGGSPAYQTPLQSPGDHEYNYNPYHNQDHGSPTQVPLTRRTSNAVPSDSRPVLLAVGTQGQTPPLQAMSANPRTPDRSLPVQEEQEDEVPGPLGSGVTSRDHYGDARGPDRSTSPTPSSDLNPEGIARYEANILSHGGRDSRAGHREDDDDTLIDQEDQDETVHPRGVRAGPDEEGGFTPRSPQSGLPPDHAMEPDRYPRYSSQNATIRARTRNGSTDQLGLHGIDPGMFSQADKAGLGSPDLDRPPPQYVEQRRDSRDAQQEYQPQQRRYDPRAPAPKAQPAYAQHIHPEDIQHYMDHPTMQAYFNSPRPDAPIPPTPHSQTAAPSPSPLIHNSYDDHRKEYPPFSPVAPAGSPYPYPFNHVRRNHSYPYTARAHAPRDNYDPNHPSTIQEQLARQWQVYAQNQSALAGGHVSDSTFSPAATPFQGNGASYNPWAYLHTNRTLGGGGVGRQDLHSLQSSPSHEPVALPIPPTVGVRKKPLNTRVQVTVRKPPPRVESTQPRSTPEPESSGEETAGEAEEPRIAVNEEGNWVAPPLDPFDEDWVDEEDEGDGEDLLELEYHPTFVSNVEKRRRRWETRWDALVQAIGRRTRPWSFSRRPRTRRNCIPLTSRSIKRNPLLSQSPAMSDVRVAFRHMAGQRRATRSRHSSLADRFMGPSNLSGDGSDVSREEDLKRALGTALGSLGALKGIYEQREARWAEEMRRISDDRERVELLLRQVLGEEQDPIGRAL